MMHERLDQNFFSTNLRSLPQVNLDFEGQVTTQQKKELRKKISVERTSNNLGFLHAVLLEINGRNFLIAGPSKIGKSTYADHLKENLGAIQIANDWVAVEREGSDFYASDLNFKKDQKKTERSYLSGIIFLTKNDELSRDAFIPNDKELNNLLKEVFDTASDEELKKLSIFWNENSSEIPFLCALPARRGTQQVVAETLTNLVRRERLNQHLSVGIIGLGSIGAELVFQIGQLPFVEKVNLYTRNISKAIGIGMDMNQGISEKNTNQYYVYSNPEDLISSSTVIFMAFRDGNASINPLLPERWQKISGHLDIIKDYSRVINSVGFDGTVFMMTNPVDILTYALYTNTQGDLNSLRTYQVYGLGLEVDIARSKYYLRQSEQNSESLNLSIYGNHSDEFVINSNLNNEENSKLHDKVSGASKEIRNYVSRTIYGPVAAATRTLKAFQKNGPTFVTSIQEDAYIGRQVYFENQLPKIQGKIMDEDYRTILQKNRNDVENLFK